jgi:NAD(P)-dependent dehydrogenase (short-subunit alcohol dehydrogenase family)
MVTGTPRTILVTGATRGIGHAAVEGLAALGHTVLLGARNLERGQAAAASIAGNVEAVAIDVTDHASVTAAARHVGDRFGRLDGLVNNAGYLDKPSESQLDDFRAVFATYVFGVVDVTMSFLPLLSRSAFPRIVNVSSYRGSLGWKDSWVGPWSTAYAPPNHPSTRSLCTSPESLASRATRSRLCHPDTSPRTSRRATRRLRPRREQRRSSAWHPPTQQMRTARSSTKTATSSPGDTVSVTDRFTGALDQQCRALQCCVAVLVADRSPGLRGG